jgi:hypothetical protein
MIGATGLLGDIGFTRKRGGLPFDQRKLLI